MQPANSQTDVTDSTTGNPAASDSVTSRTEAVTTNMLIVTMFIPASMEVISGARCHLAGVTDAVETKLLRALGTRMSKESTYIDPIGAKTGQGSFTTDFSAGANDKLGGLKNAFANLIWQSGNYMMRRVTEDVDVAKKKLGVGTQPKHHKERHQDFSEALSSAVDEDNNQHVSSHLVEDTGTRAHTTSRTATKGGGGRHPNMRNSEKVKQEDSFDTMLQDALSH